jgi:diguanylate cyclase
VARSHRAFSVVLLDIDHFKNINDAHGHDVGDTVLRMIGQVLRNSLRTSDFAARYGGEEFVVLLPETDLTAAAELAERLRKHVEAADLRADSAVLHVTASFGVAAFPTSVRDANTLVKTADEMLYKAKESGRNRVEVAPPAGTQTRPGR